MDTQNLNKSQSSNPPEFIGNGMPFTLSRIHEEHIIPVFHKDNSALISQARFVELSEEVIKNNGLTIVEGPHIQLSHPVKGRIPEARFKKSHELLPHEQTIYYERMIFLYKLSTGFQVNNDKLSFVIGGVKAYNQDNLNKDSRALQNFKIFIGCKVQVCSNLCIWTDGSLKSIKVNTMNALEYEIDKMIKEFQPQYMEESLCGLDNLGISENQFAQVVGRMRMYDKLPTREKQELTPISITDTQMNQVVKGYYEDNRFGGMEVWRFGGLEEKISLWSFYNLLTEATKSSYIDSYIDRNYDAGVLTRSIQGHLLQREESYFLS